MKIDRIKSAQANFLHFQNNLIDTTISTDGEVKVIMNGKLQIISLEFNKNVNNEVILKTINEAIEKVSRIVQIELMKVQKIMQS
jgi:DNA-binding protein YbaB